MDDVTGRCAEERIALGAYVLGALDPDDRSRTDAHLADCSRCREELSLLAELPAVLGRLDLEDVLRLEEGPPPVPVTNLPGRTREDVARRGQATPRPRRSVRRRWVGVAAALLLVIVGGVAGLRLMRPGPESRTVSGTNTATAVHATAELTDQPSGTAVSLRLGGVPPRTHCELIAVARDGGQETAASWAASYEGDAQVRGWTGIPLADLASLRVVTSTAQLLVIPVP